MIKYNDFVNYNKTRLGKLEISNFDFSVKFQCRNPTLKECEDDTHTLEMGTYEFSKTPENLELIRRGQNTSP